LNGAAQPATKPFGNIAANGSGQVSWVIRGDVPGKYKVTGTATAQGFAPTSLQSNDFEVIEPKLSVSLDLAQAPATLTTGQQFRIGVKVRNDSI
jgi:hypothetical protein